MCKVQAVDCLPQLFSRAIAAKVLQESMGPMRKVSLGSEGNSGVDGMFVIWAILVAFHVVPPNGFVRRFNRQIRLSLAECLKNIFSAFLLMSQNQLVFVKELFVG